ncbi:ribosome maturation factor RimM [Alloscardovia sp. HMSC034E08]|uniref:ribosome maturation factor RimM n=1 Tax=Alloscardovia sp. HMSC034E08 TaxID=1739413 RepID=UPI0008C8E8F9|nr:ribosome maturation factor RimM [Alloscardovia sp. HMSC034E08]OFQ97694.1 16S rRNA processing protein RimM [Alloscardovia sp. HMSC034E08]
MRAADSTHTNPQQRTLLRVCRIGRAQGLKGEVNVRAFTDDPENRFAPGSVLLTKDGREFRVMRSRNFKSRWIILFEGISNRNASEELNGIDLFIDKEADLPTDGEDEGWYLADLVGLDVLEVNDPETARAADYDGVEVHEVGTISAVYNNTAQDLLEVKNESGKISLIPFVEDIVPVVDVDEGYVIIDPPAGLLDL